MTDRARWAIVTGALFATLALVIWLVTTESPFIHWMIRLYQDKHFLKETVRSWGWMAPLVFIAIQALQVIISPIPGEITGPVGGALFGTTLAIICFIIYLVPGFPKDIVSYLFGISPMPFWIFATISTIARIPGTWVSSYFGAHVAEQQYIYAIAFLAVVVALCLPLYYYRDRFIKRFHKPK